MSTVITPESQAFIDKWAVLFADNEFENITEKTYRDFTADVAQLREQGQYRQVQLTASANSAESLLAGKEVQPGRLYAIKGTPDPTDPKGLSGTWNASGDEQTVYVLGLAPALFASLGCLLDAATGITRPVQVEVAAGTHQALQGSTIWYYVGDPTLQSVSLGQLDLTSNVFDPNGLSESNIFFAAQFVSNNTFGADFSGNVVYGELRYCTIGANCYGNVFRPSVTDCTLGYNVTNCYFDTNTHHVEVEDSCQRVSLYNCAGTAQQPFVVPAGTTDATYRNNQLVNKADEDGRFDLLTPTDPAVPESAIRGSINWRYKAIGAVGQWDVEPGKSVMLINGCNLRTTLDVVEGDIFGVYINPANAKTRIVLSTTEAGGIDGEPSKRYTKGTSIVFRYTLFPAYLDPNGVQVPARYGLQTLQLSPPTAVNNRGAWAAATYYLPGDLVSLNNVLYLRQVEGSDTGALDPTKWAGGGAAASGPQLVNSTVLRFDKSYTHTPIASGTFTTDTSTAQVNSEVSVMLAATATDPAASLPAATFQLLAGAYANGVELLYTFKVGANGKIQYVINQLP